MDKPTILLTGGGSAGHVTPNIALIQSLQPNWKIVYIGGKTGIESQLIKPLGIPYYTTPTGKLRRYFSWQNFIDPFKVLFGIIKCTYLCRRIKPKVVFSKGGFVALPVVVGAWLNRIPVVIHESDLTSGLANRLCMPFAKKICLTFSETKKNPRYRQKYAVTGTPIRHSLLHGSKQKGLSFTGLTGDKPILLIILGGSGSLRINAAIDTILDKLLEQFDVIHLRGKGNLDPKLTNKSGYIQYEYINEELGDLFACSDLVISRAGSNALYELLTLGKPHLLIPIARIASRGDQIQNAHYFEKQGYSHVLLEEQLTNESLLAAIKQLYQQRAELQHKLQQFQQQDAIVLISQKLEALVK